MDPRLGLSRPSLFLSHASFSRFIPCQADGLLTVYRLGRERFYPSEKAALFQVPQGQAGESIVWQTGFGRHGERQQSRVHEPERRAPRNVVLGRKRSGYGVTHLVGLGYSIRSVADTASRAPGTDIVAVSSEGGSLVKRTSPSPETSP